MSDEKSSSNSYDQVDEIVRKAYETFVNEELPERFLILLEKLKSGESPEDDTSSGGDI